MRLNLGCGNRKVPGWVNVDKVPACQPDEVVDIEKFPWPWPDDSVEEVMLSHVLEHIGAETQTYLGFIQELYRVCRNGAKIVIIVPHPRHDFFLGDPTHVRPITPDGLALFSQSANRQWIANGAANTPLGIYLGVDFSIESVNLPLDEPWRTRHERKQIADDELQHAVRHYNNVVVEYQIVLRAVKPAGSGK